MVAAVVLDHQPGDGIVEIGSAQELPIAVVQISLNLRAWQAGLDQEPAKARLHRRFGGARDPYKGPVATRTLPASNRTGVSIQFGGASQAQADRHIDGNKSFNGRPSMAEIQQRPEKGCGLESSDRNRLAREDFATTDAQTSAGSDSGIGRHDDLDWIGGVEVEPQDPGRSGAREDRVGRQHVTPPC
ncbi:MAG TPA: hypothetical protein VHW94_13075 [Candidatus Dormibacteraeota bacterium]|nr:hypothetical protein [Candidatus Dormibacteraeota bacterium]